jgi:L-aminopeptidase/D-esterase-like protein
VAATDPGGDDRAATGGDGVVRVGHWSDPVARTGCTVVTFPEGTVASGEVRGGAPASRELALLEPIRTVARIDALVLTGGSAFGLASADGVVRWCEERGRGFATAFGRVPIVVALALYDLDVGDPGVRPDAAAGYAAARDGAPWPDAPDGGGEGPQNGPGRGVAHGPVLLGPVGAGVGATVGEAVLGRSPRPGGLVAATVAAGDLMVSALVAVNAAGLPGGDSALATDPALARPRQWSGDAPEAGAAAGGAGTNTTIGLVTTNARLDKLGCLRVAQGAHDGLARAVFPPHTGFDGDAFVAASVGGGRVDATGDAVRALAVHAVAEAIGALATPDTRR